MPEASQQRAARSHVVHGEGDLLQQRHVVLAAEHGKPVRLVTTLGVGQAIVWASALSYLGLGAEPPAPEWGAMLSAGRTYLASAWWLTVFPGLAIVLTTIATTVLGGRLRGAR